MPLVPAGGALVPDLLVVLGVIAAFTGIGLLGRAVEKL